MILKNIVYLLFIGAASLVGDLAAMPAAETQKPSLETVSAGITIPKTRTSSQENTRKVAETFPEMEDIVVGYPDAKIALVEYSSINCAHCAAFHKAFSEQFHDRFIRTHKAQLVFKHFPLDYTAVEYMSLIVKQPKNQWLPLFEKALATQSQWLGKKPEVLAKILGISENDCRAALTCQQTKQLIMAKRFNAEQVVEINATPTFLIIYRKSGALKFELLNEGVSPDALLTKLDHIYQDIS